MQSTKNNSIRIYTANESQIAQGLTRTLEEQLK